MGRRVNKALGKVTVSHFLVQMTLKHIHTTILIENASTDFT